MTQVAVRLVAAELPEDDRLWAVLLSRAGMLAHLSNVPDTYWRNASAAVVKANAPTHYIALDDFGTPVMLVGLPANVKTAAGRAKLGGRDLASQTGTAPWRIEQLVRMMEQALTRARQGGAGFSAAVDEALLYAGLLSHFVGDLSQPDHTSRTFDGVDRGQRGIHSYFESALVDVLPLDLEPAVLDQARLKPRLASLCAALPEAERAACAREPAHLALALAADSYTRRDDMFRLDATHAVSAPATGDAAPARRSPREVASEFRPLITERLAVSAEVLAVLWQGAWERADRPDLRPYASRKYPLQPAFVPPDYLR